MSEEGNVGDPPAEADPPGEEDPGAEEDPTEEDPPVEGAVVQIGGDIGSLPAFTVGGDSSSTAIRWKKWKRSFGLYLQGKGVVADGQKKALMLHTAGVAVQDIYFTKVEEEKDKKTYHEAVKVLDDYFIPKSNVAFERHLFRQMKQQSGESVDDLVCRLRQKAATCDFGTQVDVHIRDQVIEAGLDPKLKRKFLERGGNLELTTMLDIARAHESVGRQLLEMTGQVNALSVGQGKKDTSRTTQRGPHSTFQGRPRDRPRDAWTTRKPEPRAGKSCYSCGRQGHISKDTACPARGKTCSQCGKMNHFKAVCRGKRGQTQRKSNTNQVEQSADYVFGVQKGRQGDGTVTLKVGGVILQEVLIDSGATCNILSKDTWESMKNQQVKVWDQHKNCRKLYPYGSNTALPTLGTFTTSVLCPSNGVSTEGVFVVLDGPGRDLLGKKTAEKLMVLQVGPMQKDRVNNLQEGLTPNERNKYKDAFTGVGLLKGHEVTLHIDETVRPVAQSLRRVPYGLRDKVDEKLDQLLELDIIEAVPEEPTGWVSPLVVVPKADGDIRICVDMRRANEAIVRERQPIPTVEDILHDLSGSTVFSKLDLKWGFHQVPLKEESRHITTFVTHRGLYRYKRLMFGISSAPEKYQQLVKEVLRGCEGVKNIADDVIVHGRGDEEHDKRLHHALDKIQQAGLTVNPGKCLFRVPKLTFFGHVVTPDGVNPSEEKIAAIREAEAPKTVGEVRSFLGLVHYVAKFIPNLATMTEPLQKLTRKGVEFKWSSEQQKSFEKLKELITSTETLAYFRPTGKTRIVADASPVGLGAVLLQLQDEAWRVIAYASRQLSEVERRYSQTEKEALALVWACERFHLYTFGREFELETDHRPLEHIYATKSKPSFRVERWVLRLQAYPYKVVYRPGKTNIADALSRLNNSKSRDKSSENYDYVRSVVEASTPVSLTPREIERASGEDPELRQVRRCIQTGQWDECQVMSYRHVKTELSTYGQLILRGTRIVIPQVLRKTVVQLAHEGHQGIQKTKNRLRTKVWWPKMEADAEAVCKRCHGCQVVSEQTPPEPMARVMPPTGAWQACGADLLGPLPTGETILVVVDYYSRFYEIAIMKSTSSRKVIEALEVIFARFGNPCSLRTDNGPQFVSAEFAEFLQEQGIQHQRTTPLWPQANGEVERQNRTLMKAIKVSRVEGKDWRREILKHIQAYRSTPQATTGETPYKLMFGREMRSKLPELPREPKLVNEEVRDRDFERKTAGKDYADAKRQAKESTLQPGDRVLVKQEKRDKFSTQYEATPYEVIERDRGEVTVRDPDGKVKKRNVSFMKKYVAEEAATTTTGEETTCDETTCEETSTTPDEEAETEIKTGSYVTRSGRVVKPPERLNL
ncbi:RTL1 [Branchiostoma lanceolatum]|uniref:Gypsy retrotransposon integrase-like protein 1 n=1 Tax=Branchiostoma lanceolatum TaxID=7740 RepID=A0A8J9ZL87_BRALA|nr:RTL1 [Branchiostoma lanceolatum]